MADPGETPIGTVTPERFRPDRVRHQVVVGPKFLYALFNPQDRMHAVSRAFMTFVRDGELPYRRLIVNEHIVDEAFRRRLTDAYYDDRGDYETVDAILGHEEALRVKLLREPIDWTPASPTLNDGLPSDEAFITARCPNGRTPSRLSPVTRGLLGVAWATERQPTDCCPQLC